MRTAIAVALVVAFAQAAAASEPPTMRVYPGLVAACARLQAAARTQHLRWRVVCPVVVPRVRQPVLDYAGGYIAVNDLRGGYGFGSSSFYAGNGYGHWTLESGPAQTLLRGLFDVNAAGKSADRVTGPVPIVIAGVRASLYRVATGTSGYAAHVAVVWRRGPQAFMVTVHRWRGDRLALAQTRAVAMSVIQQLRG